MERWTSKLQGLWNSPAWTPVRTRAILATLLALQLGAAAALALRSDRLAPAAADAPFITADWKNADRLEIDGARSGAAAAARIEIVKRDGRWVLPGYHGAPADASRITALLDRLAKMQRGALVATTSSALVRFKVADEEYERRLVAQAGGKALATLYLGNSPGLRKVYARSGADEKVYAVELASADLPTAPADWFDLGLLTRDAKSLAEVELTRPGTPPLVLRRADADAPWQSPGLPADRAVDQAKATALANAVSQFRVGGVLGTSVDAAWQLDKPVLQLALKGKDGPATTWVLAKPASGDFHVAKVSDQPWYLQVQDWSAKTLLDSAASDKLIVTAAAGAAPAASAAPATAGASVPAR